MAVPWYHGRVENNFPVTGTEFFQWKSDFRRESKQDGKETGHVSIGRTLFSERTGRRFDPFHSALVLNPCPGMGNIKNPIETCLEGRKNTK